MSEQEMQFELMKSQEKVNALRQGVAAMNKEREDWRHYRIQAAIAVLQGITPEWGNNAKQYAEWAVQVADALVEELKRSDDVYAECRRMDAINTAAVCENMTKLQELQKKGGQDEDN